MQRLLMLSAILIASVQLNASHLASELNLRLQQQDWFTLNIDNRIFDKPVNHFHMGDLAPGNHYLQVTRLDNGYYGPFSVPVSIFNGYINIPARSRVNAYIDRFGRLRINNITALGPVCMPAPVAIECPPVPAPYGMSNYEFDQLRSTIDHLSFESSKMQVARQALSVNRVTSQQVCELVRMMAFESSKLELAKLAYYKTVDKQNYFILNDTFAFESSILDLNNFIYRS